MRHLYLDIPDRERYATPANRAKMIYLNFASIEANERIKSIDEIKPDKATHKLVKCNACYSVAQIIAALPSPDFQTCRPYWQNVMTELLQL